MDWTEILKLLGSNVETVAVFFFCLFFKLVPTDALFCPTLSGDSMRQASGEFAEDPCSSVKRGNMVRAARALLSAVTHLLVLADMSDVYKLLVQLKLVRQLFFFPFLFQRFSFA